MYSELLSGGALRLGPRGGSGEGTLPSVKDEERPIESLVVIRRERRREGTDSSPLEQSTGSRGSLQNVVNKRNAIYLTQEEYDEDLAQLDILLHYVNNLSASLEFLQWEKKRISTDLVPTLLNMYDALYAKFSESSDLNLLEANAGDVLSEEAKKKAKERLGGEKDERENEKNKSLSKENERELFILEPNHNSTLPSSVVENQNCRCGKNSSSGEHCLQCHKLPKIEVVENDYDIPESMERDTDSLRSCSPKPPLGIPFLKTSSPASSFRMSKDRSRFRSLIEDVTNSNSKHTTGSVRSYRPVSVISSSSSSSSSSNSLPRGPTGGLASYMASAESLNDNDTLHSDTDASSRRRDRSLKARREKALRAGSDDSGVQCHIISLPAPPSSKPRYCDPNLHYMDRVVLEIVETEELYVRDLKDVIEGYLEYWRNNPEEGVSEAIFEDLFSNIEQIYRFNKCFLSELEICGTDPVFVAKCFVRNNAGFAIYTEYCTNYPRTVSLLTDLMREERSVRACRERQLALCHTLPLGSYLLKPVQRVLKYHLLLGNIVKNFNKDRAGHSHIWNALSAMTGIAHHINDMKRRHEHAIRVQEIQSLLYGWQGEDLTTYGELAAEGNFKMFGFKGLRHVFLFDKMLLITKRKDENYLVYKAHIMCSDLMLIESIPGEPLSFHVIPFDNPKCQYTLECRNLDQKREWTLQLKRVILENYSATIPAHARQLVMELGQAKTDDLSGSDWKSSGGSRKTHHAPEYLERRKDKRRTSEGGFNARLRIRRSSRTRKNKEDDNRSRSVSRNRTTDDDEERKHSSASAASPVEKSRLRLPMWRRRSEPFVKSGLSISSPQGLSTSASFTEELSPNKREEEEENVEKSEERETEEVPREASPAEGVCEQLFSQYDCDETEGENLEHIVSQLLQHQLQMQQIILNKQRRGLLRKKKLGPQYETSDTENDDGGFESPLPPLPTSPPPLLTNSRQTPLPFPSEYKTLSLPSTEREIQGASQLIASRNGSDFEVDAIGNKLSNYDNLMEVWRGTSSPTQLKINSLLRIPHKDILEDSSNCNKLTVRRTHSLSNSSIHSNESQNYCTINASTETAIISASGSEVGTKERPATIAIYEEDIKSSSPEPSIMKYANKQSHISLDNLVSVHPEHKIYSKALVSKSNLRKVLNKLTGPKSSPHKTVSEPSNSLSNIYVNSEFDAMHRKSGLVSCMARQCSRSLKERIKQIRTEDWDSSPKSSSSNDPLLGLSVYKQGSSSIGARLAAVNEPSDYAVPVIHPLDKSTGKSELRPDSVLSSSSSNSSGRESEPRTIPEVGDTSGDSFYEKSFEAIENFLDDEMFRDSAIYSDQEDGQDTPSGGTLSPKNSFSYKYRSSFRGDSRSSKIFNSFNKTKVSTANSEIIEEQHLVSEVIQTSLTRTANKNTLENFPLTKKIPPPVPVKPDTSMVQKFRSRGVLIQQQLKTFEGRMKSPHESSEKFEDKMSLSQDHCLVNGSENGMSKGWVKQVVGKLQQ